MTIWKSTLLAGTVLATCTSAWAGQAPGALSAPDVAISHHDRVYAAEQFSNTLSVTDPVDNKLLGVIKLGDPQPAIFSPLYKGQVLVHGMGYSPNHRTLAAQRRCSDLSYARHDRCFRPKRQGLHFAGSGRDW